MPLIGENMTFGALCDHSRTQCAPVDALDEQPSGVASKKAARELLPSEQTQSQWSWKQSRFPKQKQCPFKWKWSVDFFTFFLKLPTHCHCLALDPLLKRRVVGKKRWVGWLQLWEADLIIGSVLTGCYCI